MPDAPPPRDPRLSMDRRFTWAFFLPLLAVAVTELIGLFQHGSRATTLSGHIWKLTLTWPGALIYALLYWLTLWHLPWARWRSLSWPDALAAAVGVAVWWLARRHYLVTP